MVISYNFRGHSTANKKSTKVIPCIFALALTVSDILTFQIFYFQKVDDGDRVQIFK